MSTDDADPAAYLRRRLVVAAVLFVPLSDLSVLLSLFPAYRFAGWQWVLLALAAPVAGWAAWPFDQAALRNARHGGLSMDSLVSLGIIAACGWSVYAMFALAPAGFCNPLIAAAAMAFSSAFVVGNSVRLRRFGTGPSSWRTRLGWRHVLRVRSV